MKALLITVLASGCASTPYGESRDPLQDFAAALTGNFNSTAQSIADPENFFDITLAMHPIWEARSDGPWLYVEQAVTTAQDRPYRQRVYHLVALKDGRFLSEVYTLPGDPKNFVGAWKSRELINEVKPHELSLREGCSITMNYVAPGTYEGATTGQGCLSSLGDAAYATSEVTLAPGVITSWDRGWTLEGEQAWGAEMGAYVFDLVE